MSDKKIAITNESILGALRDIVDPERNADIVSLNMIRNVRITGTDVNLTMALTPEQYPAKGQLQEMVKETLAEIGVTGVIVDTISEPGAPVGGEAAAGGGCGGCPSAGPSGGCSSGAPGGGPGDGFAPSEGFAPGTEPSAQSGQTSAQSSAQASAQASGGQSGQEGPQRLGHHGQLPPKAAIPGVAHTIAVASGKGGVGKSTVSVNLAVSLAKQGAKVGLLDTDIYGPSIPLMMGVQKPIKGTPDDKLIPHEAYGVKLMSVGFMLEEDQAVIWRGPLVMQLVSQFLKGVEWGELDYLIIDLPPGTGDTQLTLVQTIPLTGVVVVTTPQDVALIDARRAITMFGEVDVPVVGIVENMSFFECPNCHEKTEIFSEGGGESTSERYEVPLLGKVPIDIDIRLGGDTGKPLVDAKPDSINATAFLDIGKEVTERIVSIDAENKRKEAEAAAHAKANPTFPLHEIR